MQYWSKKYFKLGLTYMIELRNPKDFTKKNNFSMIVHSFLDSIREKKLSKNHNLLLLEFINNLENCTQKQKRRFLMYYNLIPKYNTILSYSDIGRIEHCSISAIKTSIISVTSKLICLEDSQKDLLLAIIKTIKI